MSKVALQEVMSELEALPEPDQQLVLGLLRALKRRHVAVPSPATRRRGNNPALKVIDGLLVFTGDLEDHQTDWIKVVREERDATFIRNAVDHSKHQ